MTDLAEIHNTSTAAAVREIVKPTLMAGGEAVHVMLVLESTTLGVLLAAYPFDSRMAAGMFEEAVVPGVIKRLAEIAKKRGAA